MHDDNSQRVFIPCIFVFELLHLITRPYNGGLSSDQKEKSALGVESTR